MARNFQILDRDPAGAVWTLTVPAGEAFPAEVNHSYRIVIDANGALPAGTTIKRVGKDLKIRLPDGDEVTISGWAETQGATLDARGAQLLSDTGIAAEQAFIASGEPGAAAPQSMAAAGIGEPTPAPAAAAAAGEAAAAAPMPAEGAAPAVAAAVPEVIPVPPAPASGVAPIAAGGGGGMSVGAILGGVAALAALGAAAGGGGGSSSGGGGSPVVTPPNVSAAPSDLILGTASDSGTLGDRITSDTTPTISGRADANATITVRSAAGTTIATATADSAGNWSATPTVPLGEGPATLQVIANRGGGATDSAATAITLTIDSTAPTAPVSRLDASSDSGTAGDNRTNDATPTLSGVGTAGDTIRVALPGSVVVTTTVAANGSWSVTPTAALADGAIALSVTATDPAGNASAAAALTVTIDTVAPAAPVARLDVTSDSGAAGDNRTNDTTPTISGTGTAGDLIAVTLAGRAPALTTNVAANGAWSVTPVAALAAGANSVSVTATDAAGNVSAATSFTLTIDTLGPQAPTAQLAASSDSGTAGDNITNDATPTISGTGTAGDTIRMSLPGGTVLTTTVAGNGTWSLTPAVALANGANALVITATNPAGNVSAPTLLTVTVDTTAPTAPTVRLDATSDSGVSGDNRTNDTTPTISGTGTAGDTITVTLPSGPALITTVAANGTWSVTPAVALGGGANAISVTATDAAANVSPAAALTVTVDTTGPGVPVAQIAAGSDSGALGDNITNDATPTISGTGTTGDSIRVTLPSGTVLTTSVANGTWSVTPSVALADGLNPISVTATDAAGNVSAATLLTITIDTSAPAEPFAALAEVSDSGTLGDNRTNDSTPTISGTGSVGDSIRVTFPSGPVLTATVAEDGTWNVTPSTAQSNGPKSISVTATDAAGNVSAATTLTVTIDTTGPAPPTAQLASASDSGTPGDNRTNDATPTISGTGTAGDTIIATLPGGAGTLTATVAGNGTWSVTPSTALANGAAAISVTATDAAGNVSPATVLNLTIDSVAPAAPTLVVAEGPVINQPENADGIQASVAGGFASGDTVAVTVTRPDASSTTVTRAVTAGEVSSGVAIVTVPAQSIQGAYSLVARITDAAGNVGANSATVGVTLDTQSLAAPSLTLPEATAPDTFINDAEAISGGGAAVTVTLPVGAVANDTVTLLLSRPGGLSSTINYSLTAGDVAGGSATVTIPTASLATDGAYSVTATVTDGGGNTSPASAARAFTVDRTAPTPTSAPDLSTASDTGTSSTDNITTDQTPTFTGNGAANGATVNLYDTDGTTLLGTDTASGGGGSWSITSSSLAAGVHIVTAREADAAGNLSSPSPSLAVTIDRQGPTFGNALVVNEGFSPVTLSSTTLGAFDDVTAQGSLRVTAATFQSATGFVAGDFTINVSAGEATVSRDSGTTDKNGSVVIAVTMQDAAGNSTLQNVTLTVNPVNDAPAGVNATVTTSQNTNLAFTASNFAFTDAADSPANALQAVVITTLPVAGQLLLSGAAVSAGQEISAASIAAGNLVFAPGAIGSGAGFAQFTFQVRDNGGTANGGVNLDPTPNVMTINVASMVVMSSKTSGGDSLAGLLGVDPSEAYLTLVDDGSGSLVPGEAMPGSTIVPEPVQPIPAGSDLLAPGAEIAGSSLASLY